MSCCPSGWGRCLTRPADPGPASTTSSSTAAPPPASRAAVQAARMGKSVVVVIARQAPRRPDHRRPGLDRHRQQGRHRRHRPRVLPARSRSTTTAPRRGRSRSPRSTSSTARDEDAHVDLRAARRRADLRRHWSRSTTSPSSASDGSTARTASRRTATRIVVDHARIGGKTFAADVHRRHLRGRPDGRRRRVVHRRPRGERQVRRDAQRRPGRAAPTSHQFDRPGRSLRRAGRPDERPAAGIHAGRPARTARATSASRPTASACA